MAQLQKGTTYAATSPDNQVTYANLNALVDDAILLPGAITAQTPLTATAGGDRVLVADLSAADGLKAVTLANLLPPEVITGKTDLSTGLAAGDTFLVSDVSASDALLKVTASNLLVPEVITGKTDLTTTLAAADVFLVSDTSASGALMKVSADDLLVPEAITGKTALTAPATDDVVLISDTSASGALKQITLANLRPRFSVSGVALTAGVHNSAHGFTVAGSAVAPYFVRWVLVMGSTTENGYSEGDEVDVAAFSDSNSTVEYCSFTWGADTTNVWFVLNSTATLLAKHKTTGASATFTAARWTAKCYAGL